MSRVYSYSFDQTVTLKLQGFDFPSYAVTSDNKNVSVEDIPVCVLSEMCNDWRAAVFAKAGKGDPKWP